MKKQRPLFSFYGQLYDIRTKRDGGGRLQLDFNGDCLIPIQQLQQCQINGDVNLAIAIVPFYNGEEIPRIAVEEDVNE